MIAVVLHCIPCAAPSPGGGRMLLCGVRTDVGASGLSPIEAAPLPTRASLPTRIYACFLDSTLGMHGKHCIAGKHTVSRQAPCDAYCASLGEGPVV